MVVSGCGPVGLSMICGARQKNPKCLIAIDLVDSKVSSFGTFEGLTNLLNEPQHNACFDNI